MLGSGLVATGWAGLTGYAILTHHTPPLGLHPAVAVVIGIATIAFAIWCARADDVWRLAPNSLEHRVGIGQVATVRRYRDAEIGVLTYWNRWQQPFGRLYIVDSSGRHFLFERNPDEASAVADFLCAKAGYPRHDFPPGSGF